MAVLHIIEAWVDEDRAIANLTNGMLSRAERTSRVATARAKASAAMGVLSQRLPPTAYANLLAGLQSIAPASKAPVGDCTRRWGRPGQRLATARPLLKAASDAERHACARAEAQRKADETEAARITAEEARRDAEAQAAERRRAERATTLARYRAEAESVFISDFLEADTWFQGWDTGHNVSAKDFGDWKAQFVQRWARDVLMDDQFDIDQARAVATTTGDLRLVARAGSGKTRILVTRALFLQLHCQVDPEAIMLAAFNTKAVREISKRIGNHLPRGSRRPHIVTFHALAYALLRPEEDLVFDDEDAASYAQSSKVQAVVDDFILSRPDDVRAAMLSHFRDDWKVIKSQGLDLDRDAFFASRATTTKVTLGGQYVKSHGERLIANVLYENDIEYKYERNFTRGGFNYRPDFTILVNGRPRIVIEYFGVTGDPEYLRNAEHKRQFWRSQSDLVFLEFNSTQVASVDESTFESTILAAVDEAGIRYHRLTPDQVWQRARRRAVDTFSKAMRSFVTRARQLNMTPDDIRERLDNLNDPEDGVAAFVDLASDVYEAYLNRAQRDGYEDFSGIMWRAAQGIRAGATTWVRDKGRERGNLRDLRFIHIDEFQDFSLMFMEFIQAIRSQTSEAVLCCVGDDWQAINGFAGADLRFFEDFETEFPGSLTQHLARNYRSPRRIVSAGNAVMDGLGEPAIAERGETGMIGIARLEDFRPSISERHRFPGDVGTPALLRLVRHGLDNTHGTVAILFRRNTVPWFTNNDRATFGRTLEGYLAYLQRLFTDDDARRLEVTTSHKFKGREADCVIVAGADAKSYPLIHPTAELFEVFGDSVTSLYDAERRLFYVATTRAETQLCYLVTTEEPTPFLDSVRGFGQLVSWHDLDPVEPDGRAVVEVRVHDGYEVREQLKTPFGFKYDGDSQAWCALRPAADFDFDHLRRRLAFVGARLIEVRDSSDHVIHRAGARLKRQP